MGVKTFNEETTSPVPPARLFKALVLDAHELVPKVLPDAVKSVQVTPGEGGAPTVVHIVAADGRSVKHRFDVVEKEQCHCRYTLVEGPELALEGVESVVYELKFEASGDGGSRCRRSVEVHAADPAKVDEAAIKLSNENAGKLFKAIEAYLLANPSA